MSKCLIPFHYFQNILTQFSRITLYLSLKLIVSLGRFFMNKWQLRILWSFEEIEVSGVMLGIVDSSWKRNIYLHYGRATNIYIYIKKHWCIKPPYPKHYLRVLWSTKKYSRAWSSSMPKKSCASRRIWQNWTSSPIGNWLGIPPSSGPCGPWTMIFFAEGTLAVSRIEASTWKCYKIKK